MDVFGTDTIASCFNGLRHVLISGAKNLTKMPIEIRETLSFFQRSGELELYGSALFVVEAGWIFKMWYLEYLTG
jgi:hypothetical protein